MERPLHIPPSKKWKGLTVFCYKCKTNVADICKETGKPIQRCPYGDKHAFKVYVHVPGTDNTRRTKKLDTRDVNEAIKQAMEFEKGVKHGNYEGSQIIESKEEKEESKKEVKNTPHLLVHALARYLGFLCNENVPAHRKKERSIEHIKDNERAFKLLIECIEENKINISTLNVDEVNDETVGIVFDYLINKKGFSNRTYNKYLSFYTTFFRWYGIEYNLPIRNFFERAERKKLNSNPQSITKDEYERLLKQITPENGINYGEKGEKLNRNAYRPFLANSIRCALETGRRREEVINLRFDNIIADDSGNSFIKVEDYKVNRIQNRTTEAEKKFIYIPVTDSLRQLLIKLGYEKYKGTSSFILAPDIKTSRTKVMSDILSRGFTHYFNQISDRKLTFKSLRKTYITNLSLFMGESAKSVTGHSDNAVIERHYLDKQALAKAAQGFSVFSKEIERKNELSKTRNNTKTKQRKVDIEK